MTKYKHTHATWSKCFFSVEQDYRHRRLGRCSQIEQSNYPTDIISRVSTGNKSLLPGGDNPGDDPAETQSKNFRINFRVTIDKGDRWYEPKLFDGLFFLRKIKIIFVLAHYFVGALPQVNCNNRVIRGVANQQAWCQHSKGAQRAAVKIPQESFASLKQSHNIGNATGTLSTGSLFAAIGSR